ncbi:MAG: transcription-repair coupling factor [Deinococcales bacterium]
MMRQRLLGLPMLARMSLFCQEGAAILITTSERLALYRDGAVFGKSLSQNPFVDTWPYKSDKIVLSLEHALRAFPQDLSGLVLDLELTKDYPRQSLLDKLFDFGYERDSLPGFSVRGDRLEIFLSAEDETDSLVLEFFGDTLDEFYHKSHKIKHYRLSSRIQETHADAAWDSTVLQELKGKIYLDAPELFSGELSPLENDQLRLRAFWDYCQTQEVISFGRDPLLLEEVESPWQNLPYYRGKLAEFSADAEVWLRDGYSIDLILRFERTGHYLSQKIIDHLPLEWTKRLAYKKGAISLSLAEEYLGGFKDDEQKRILISEDLLYAYQGDRKHKRLGGKSVYNAAQLSLGDYLIHPDHGVGRFLGLEPRQVLGVMRDYLILQYGGEGKLYLPVEQLPLLRRHPGTTDTPPKLSTLGTNEWARAKERARINAQELATKLIRIYAERQLSKGVSLPALSDWDKKIDVNFPFTLTPDQDRAIQETLRDMGKSIPMDRLISGDVGFGKTEVAIRAAHRAVGHKKQVAMIVPTTVLAKQHYENFLERFKNLPVTVEMLSRFSSDQDAKLTLQGMKTGSVDIVIGTHRLLSDGILFKDLGLLIIDEEHRFGVAQKERIKGLKSNVDILSLSATPIPRTLYMSMIGLRDVSQIMTPPSGRKPIQTLLDSYNPNTVRKAVMFELERGGKSFYIHDRIGSMGSRALMLKRLIPEARIGVAHGQMSGDELEEVMLAFEEGAYDLLLSTTIVESGIDIGGANTLIIERADRLGLAQLYQLRGRVGRRQTEAWAYMLYPGKLTEQAQQRLYAIAELNDLGSGHLLAEKDMQIRGVGNLLGAEQHGHISAVSLEVYTEMLAEEIAKLKGDSREAVAVASLDLSIDARLSPSYIADDKARINFYGRLSETNSLAEIGRIRNELRANYGPLPKEVNAFLEMMRLRLLANQKGVASIKEHMTDVQISFQKDGIQNIDYDARGLKNLRFKVEVTNYPPGFSLKKLGLKSEEVLEALSEILYLVA